MKLLDLNLPNVQILEDALVNYIARMRVKAEDAGQALPFEYESAKALFEDTVYTRIKLESERLS
jgi:hypothetical protein